MKAQPEPAVRAGNLNPFKHDGIVICSYQFARSKEPYLRQTGWDLIVIDEAHRLRNVCTSSVPHVRLAAAESRRSEGDDGCSR